MRQTNNCTEHPVEASGHSPAEGPGRSTSDFDRHAYLNRAMIPTGSTNEPFLVIKRGIRCWLHVRSSDISLDWPTLQLPWALGLRISAVMLCPYSQSWSDKMSIALCHMLNPAQLQCFLRTWLSRPSNLVLSIAVPLLSQFFIKNTRGPLMIISSWIHPYYASQNYLCDGKRDSKECSFNNS